MSFKKKTNIQYRAMNFKIQSRESKQPKVSNEKRKKKSWNRLMAIIKDSTISFVLINPYRVWNVILIVSFSHLSLFSGEFCDVNNSLGVVHQEKSTRNDETKAEDRKWDNSHFCIKVSFLTLAKRMKFNSIRLRLIVVILSGAKKCEKISSI